MVENHVTSHTPTPPAPPTLSGRNMRKEKIRMNNVELLHQAKFETQGDFQQL